MFKIESYVTPILLSYVDKYVKDFKPADAQVSLWGGGVLLQNLVLKTDVLQQEVALPFTLVSGRIHELLIQVPWTKIMSEPIVVTIDTIECILNLRASTEEPKPEAPSEKTQVVEAPPGYMQALVRRVVSNIAIKVHHLIVKYVQDDIVLSLNVKQLSINSAGPSWKPAFADIEAANPAIRRLIVLDDLTLCLDSTDSDGKIRFYQDPLLYRCGLEFRVLAKLVSANTRRAKSFEVELHTTKLAWGVTTAQLLLLLRLAKEQMPNENESPSPTSAPKSPPATMAPTLKKAPALSNATEPARHESWSDWAWSWVPSSERIQGRTETPMASCPTPIAFSAYLNEVSLVIKALETESNSRKRPRSFLEFTAYFAAVKCSLCVPTYLRVKAGVRCLVLQSTGKCTCGHFDINTLSGEPTVYLSSRQQLEEEWNWPDENADVELAQAAEETIKSKPEKSGEQSGKEAAKEGGKPPEIEPEIESIMEPRNETVKEPGNESGKEPGIESGKEPGIDSGKVPGIEPGKLPGIESGKEPGNESGKEPRNEPENEPGKEPKKESGIESEKEPTKDTGANTEEQALKEDDSESEVLMARRSRVALKPIPGLDYVEFNMEPRLNAVDATEEKFWNKLSPAIVIEFIHERSPPNAYINPYDKPPKSFEYSDWEEISDVHVNLKPIDLRICMGLIHRLTVIKNIFEEIPPAPIEPMRVLTIEECEALNLNLPQRRTNIEIIDFRINVHPWDHSLTEKPSKAPLLLRIEMPKVNIVTAAPLYAQRVCSAAGQMPEDAGLLWQGCRVHTTASLNNIKVSVCSPSGDVSKPCGRIDLRFVTHSLLYPEYFEKKRSVVFSYAVKMREANISGSAARLLAAVQILTSLTRESVSTALLRSSLAKDCLADEDLVALDITAEDLVARGFETKKVKTNILTLQSLRATVFQSAPDRELQQAWVFSGPDIPTNTPYARLAFQWCNTPFSGSVDYVGLWTEPTAVAVDPLLISWLSYKPTIKFTAESSGMVKSGHSSTQVFMRRRSTITSSSGRGITRSGTADAEQVHHKVSSLGSSSEPSEKKLPNEASSIPPPKPQTLWLGDTLMGVHERLKQILIAVDLGLILIYVTTNTTTAVDCDTVRVAMEKHAAANQNVVVYSVGRWSLYTSKVTKHLWYVIEQDGPTYTTVEENETDKGTSFPWKMLLSDVSCYTLEPFGGRTPAAELSGGLRSHLKATIRVQPHTVLELVSTNVVLSVVTKSLHHKVIVKKAETSKKSAAAVSKEEAKLKYFTSGTDFKPTTFLEFLRGPMSRKKEISTQKMQQQAEDKPHEPFIKPPVQKVVSGPIVSLGFNLHADTPPVLFRIEHDQVQVIATTLHCLSHAITLLRQKPLRGVRRIETRLSTTRLNRPETDEEPISETESTESDDRLMTIFQSYEEEETGMKTFFWFQWVISRVTVVFTTESMKLAMDVDDVSMSIDLQEHYDQMKIKIDSASIKHFELTDEGTWVPGTFGGRVLAVREPLNANEDIHFLAVTITAAKISNLPESWKEELHPKLLEQKSASDTMWEIYAVLASLEVVIVPRTLDNIMLLANAISSRSSCSPVKQVERPTSTFDLPYCYLNAGGLKLLLSCDVDRKRIDDTFVVTLGKITINPHPDNPICRQPVTGNDTTWSALPGNLEGRQYELSIKEICVETTQFNQLVTEQESTSDTKITNENPAVKWSTTVVEPTLSTILHPLDIDLLLAPALFVNGTLICGAAVELNLTSDCLLEFNVDQLILVKVAKNVIRRAGKQEMPMFGGLKKGECPYAKCLNILQSDVYEDVLPSLNASITTLNEEDFSKLGTATVAGTVDSGMDTATTRSSKQDTPIKKKLSIAFAEQRYRKASDYLEVFLTTGAFEVSLYTTDDGTKEIEAIRPRKPIPLQEQKNEVIDEPEVAEVKSLTDTHRIKDFVELDLTKSYQKQRHNRPPSTKRDTRGIPLLHVTFHQPNLYYWKRRSQKSLQISLFNLWFGLGTVFMDDYWHAPIVSTTRGVPDPETEIPPALATMKYTSGTIGGGAYVSTTSLNQKGTLTLDVERPVHLDASEETVRRLICIHKLIKSKFAGPEKVTETPAELPLPYKLRRLFIIYAVEVVTIQTSQLGLTIAGATLGLDGSSLQISLSPRRDQLDARGLIKALLLTTNRTDIESQQPILHPLHIGMQMNATWEAWQRAEGGPSAKQPSVRVLVEMDSITLDLSPSNLTIVKNIRQALRDLEGFSEDIKRGSIDSDDSDDVPYTQLSFFSAMVMPPMDDEDIEDHYYKDDLRSGAFKIVSGGQLPMAYQITLFKNVVSWRYPHPRAITRIVAFPLPGQVNEVSCVLEFYSLLLNQWEPFMYINIPVSEPREIIFDTQPPEVLFSSIWRFRVTAEDEQPTKYQFKMSKFMPTNEPTGLDYAEPTHIKTVSDVTAEQLSGILRVDSYFAPSQTPRNKLTVRFTKMDINIHNSLPRVYKQAANLEGYYVSKPLMQSHRTLIMTAQEAMLHLGFGTSTGSILLFQTQLSSQIIDCATGTMEPLSYSFKLQAALSFPENVVETSRLRLCTTSIRTSLHLSRLRTLQALANDWQDAFNEYISAPSETPKEIEKVKLQEETENKAAEILEGRISLWIRNTCSVALRMGQEGTDEVFPIGPGTKLAYRWRYPDAKKRIRFAIAGPGNEWQWSNCITFAVGESRIRLPDVDTDKDSNTPGSSLFLYVTVTQTGAYRLMCLSGRLVIANMLKWNLLYKVRAQQSDNKTWKTISSGDLNEESIGRSIISSTNSKMVLKIRFLKHDTGWSGDIPLRECPKENVPWLVKVPSEGDVPYISVWCRVVRARSDGRIFAAIWPLYVLRSNLTLDTDVLLMTDVNGPRASTAEEGAETGPPPLIQTAPGRGVRTHLLAPGTTSAKHSLSFQYRNVECPVTREAVPLHYGVTDTSVFDKRVPINTIEEVLQEVKQWLKAGSQQADPYWPNSIVSRHWNGVWQPTILQPRCDVAVRYQAVRVGGGGCSLEVQLSPVLLLCNASPVLVTLRAHDAAPMCKLEPGSIVSPPSIVLQKPFFISMEIGRETFVSRQLEVCTTEPGRYGEPPPGQIAVEHPTTFAIPCHNKVTILNVHYEIKEEFNVIGLTPAFVFVNKLDVEVSIATTAVPDVADRPRPANIRPKYFKLIAPYKSGRVDYVPLCKFDLLDRWRGGDASELTMYLTVALPATVKISHAAYAAPVRLGQPPSRKPLALIDQDDKSMAVVVTQHKHEGRWVVVLAHDPCPQFLVLNRASISVMIAQPYRPRDDDNTEAPAHVEVMQECIGARWWCSLRPGSSTHYSSPSHTFSQALPTHQPHPLPLLTLAHIPDEVCSVEPEWCAPVEITAGTQLLQLSSSVTVKMRVRTYPHSTLVELQDIETTDISASDIRKRLYLSDPLIGPNTSKEENIPIKEEKTDVKKSGKVMYPSGTELAMRKIDMMQLEKDLRKFVRETAEKEAFMKEKQAIHRAKSAELQQKDNTEPLSEKSDTAEASTSNKNDTVEPLPSSSLAPDFTDTKNTQFSNITIPETKVISNEKNAADPILEENEPTTTKSITDNDADNDKVAKRVTIQHTPEIKTSEQDMSEKPPYVEPVPLQNITPEKMDSPAKNDDENPRDDPVINMQRERTSQQIVKIPSVHTSMHDITKTGTENQVLQLSSELLTIAGFKLSTTGSFISPTTLSQAQENVLSHEKSYEWEDVQKEQDRVRCTITSIVVEMAACDDTSPLLAVHIDRAHASINTINKKVKTTVSITDVQIDNLQYESGQFDFPVIATTRAERAEADSWPTIWNMFTEQSAFTTRLENSRVVLKINQDNWSVLSYKYNEFTEVDFQAGPLALYIEDAYVRALVGLFKIAIPKNNTEYDDVIMTEASSLQKPLRLRLLEIQPIDLTLTLHTAVRMYIALDQSPLHLNAFKLQHMFTSTECLAHALTVHYLSAAVLSAGWVVGGLELLGAPGALAARVGGATGGVRGIASTTAAALLRSLSACAGSLARNLDLLAGDEEHARRAAAARRRPPATFIEGLVAGVTNFAINILGAVGGLAHHPLVGVAVGETESSAAAIRRSLVGALTKPLSATADLVAYAGHGLLRQTGWDPVPQPRTLMEQRDVAYIGWRRDCVRWAFRLAELNPFAGFEVLIDDEPRVLLITNKVLVVAEAECERVIEMIDLRHCLVGPYVGGTIELIVTKNRHPKPSDVRILNEDEEYHISSAAMQRVARYTGAEGAEGGAWAERRAVLLAPAPGQSLALHAALLAAAHSNADTHFPLL